jgi:hypothetical protein
LHHWNERARAAPWQIPSVVPVIRPGSWINAIAVLCRNCETGRAAFEHSATWHEMHFS